MTRACIHLGMHNHLVFDGICRQTLNIIFSLIAWEVSKTPIAKNSTISFAAIKEFLDGYFIHSGSRLKELLWGKALEDVLYKFEILSSSNL
jgi:hypothetical protein